MKAPLSDLARKVLSNRDNKKALEELANGADGVTMFYVEDGKQIEVIAKVIQEVSVAIKV